MKEWLKIFQRDFEVPHGEKTEACQKPILDKMNIVWKNMAMLRLVNSKAWLTYSISMTVGEENVKMLKDKK